MSNGKTGRLSVGITPLDELMTLEFEVVILNGLPRSAFILSFETQSGRFGIQFLEGTDARSNWNVFVCFCASGSVCFVLGMFFL